MGNICKISSGGTRSASVAFEDPVTARRTNGLLNRWRAGEVTILQRLYRSARLTNKGGACGLDRIGFLELFETLPKPVGNAVFSLFDSTGSGLVSFRDFCRALSWCCRGTRIERLRFLFCLFAIYEQSNNTATNIAAAADTDSPGGGGVQSSSQSPTQAQLLHEELALGDLDDEDDEASPRLGRVGLEALIEFCRPLSQQSFASTPMSFKQFLDWSESALSDSVVERALQPLSVLSTPSSERRAVEEAWKDAKVRPGDTVFLVAKPWFDQWSRYAGLVDKLSNPTLPAPPLPSTTSSALSDRPDELDNSTLLRRQGGISSEGELRTEVKPGVDFVVVPTKVWELMLRWYGGGPAFGRTALLDGKVQYRPLPLRLSVCDARTGDVPTLKTSARRVGRFDPKLAVASLEKQELLLKALFSTVDGQHVGQIDDSEDEGEDEDLNDEQKFRISSIAAAVFANDSSAKDVEKDVKAALSMARSLSSKLSEKPKLGLPQTSLQKKKKAFMSMPSASPLNSSKKKLLLVNGDDGQSGTPPKSAGEKLLAAFNSSPATNAKEPRLRVWCRRGRPRETASGGKRKSKALANKISAAAPPQPGSRSWRLVSSSKFSTLESAGVEPWDELMFEFIDSAGNWPRAKLVEPPDFRNFKVGSRVDACDYLGKWFAGSIVAVSSKSLKQEEDVNDGVVRRVRVNFDRFKSQWDEWYDTTSPSLAPPGTRVPLPVKPHHPGEASSNGRNHSSGAHDDDGASSSPSHLAGEKKNGKDLKQPKAVTEQLVPGATGLVNLGNTCFMNSALQCLSHTPLLRAYCLSEAFSSEINRTNPLGSQGRMVEEFAAVLKQLWGEQFRCVAPSKFKRALARIKPQFAGNDQHDSQEFLAEMLDMLHEDVNRVVDKPYVVEPEDEEVDKLTSVVAGSEAWDRYLLRNRSVIVDLFQGQLKSERRCTTCDKRSLKFEPFMYLSVPLPAPTARPVKVVFVPNTATVKNSEKLAVEPDGDAQETSGATSTEANPIISTSGGLASLFGGGAGGATAATGSNAESSETNVSPLVEETGAESSMTPVKESGASKSNWRSYLGTGRAPRPVKYAFELPRLGTLLDLKKVLEKKTGVPRAELKVADVYRNRLLKIWDDAEPLARIGEEDLVVYQVASAASTVALPSSTACAGYEPGSQGGPVSASAQGDKSSPAKESTNGEAAWPSSIEGLGLGARVDAMDFQKEWHIGRIVEVDEDGCRRVKFDRYAPKWNEVYGPEDFGTKLKPPYTKSKRKSRIMDIQVVHRRERPRQPPPEPEEEDSSEGTANDEEEVEERRHPRAAATVGVGLELFGTPFVVRVESDSTIAKLHTKVTAHALALFASTKKRKSVTSPFTVRIASLTSPTTLRQMHSVSQNAPPPAATTADGVDAELAKTSATSSFASAPDILARGSKAFVSDLLLEESRLLLVLDWTDLSAFEDSVASAVSDKSYVDLAEDDEDATGDDNDDQQREDTEELRQLHGRKPQQQQTSQRRRGSRAPDVVPLSSCLNAFTKEETLSDDNVWFCPKCKTNRRAVSRIEAWKLPDILVIHMKRFLASSQWREKINTRVDFPLTALDMSAWVSEEARAHMPPGDTLFDLFAVINHLGVISGGHYTAFVRAVPCTRDGVEEVASSFATNDDGSTPDYRWLHVDDDIVEEVGPHQIVTDAAYVLFYRREFIVCLFFYNLITLSLQAADLRHPL